MLQKNCFPLPFVESFIKTYLANKYSKEESNDEPVSNVRYYKLPYIGQISILNLQKKLEDTVRRYCKDGIKLRIVFTTTKLSSFLSTKDLVTEVMKSDVVYKFCCAGGNAFYIGETSRPKYEDW